MLGKVKIQFFLQLLSSSTEIDMKYNQYLTSEKKKEIPILTKENAPHNENQICLLNFLFFFSPQKLPKALVKRVIEVIENSFCSYSAWEGYISVEGRMVGIFHLAFFFLWHWPISA